jgi:hypothetical protein
MSLLPEFYIFESEENKLTNELLSRLKQEIKEFEAIINGMINKNNSIV